MSRLINTEEFIKRIDHYPPDIRDTAKKELRYCKTVDAVPVVHGHWIERTDYVGDTYYDCSACGESWTTIEGDPWDNGMAYCPKCGSKMDEPMQPNDSNTLDALKRG